MDDQITIRGAREHNLRGVDLDLPRGQLVVITGLSGSGKSSLAFDTIFAEGQRRYMESLSAYARQFLGQMERPDVDHIDGLSPVIAIEQKTVSRNPRSTVGTVTEIYDFLRLLYARTADAYSYETGRPMVKQSDDEIIDRLAELPEGTKVAVLAPVVRGRKGHYRELFEQVAKQGFERVRTDGTIRRIETGMKLDRYKVHDVEVVVDRVVIKEGVRARLAQSCEIALGMGGGSMIAHVLAAPEGTDVEEGDLLMSRHLTDPESGLSYDDPNPNTFSFNSPYGACAACNGLGVKKEVDPGLVVANPSHTIGKGALVPLGTPDDKWAFAQLRAVADTYGFDFETPYDQLSAEHQALIMEGAGDEQFDIVYTYKGRKVTYQHRYGGLLQHIRHAHETGTTKAQKQWAEAFMRVRDCTACEGGRLSKEALSYRIGDPARTGGGESIADLVKMDLQSLRGWLDALELRERQELIGGGIVKEIKERLDFLLNVGLGYLTLDRTAKTLSGGESQRIRLATQIGTQLTGVLYVLDEPSIGLHPRDNTRLIGALTALRDLGNSVLVVEHDREMIEAADFLVDLGPGAGEQGGRLLGAGTPQQLAKGTGWTEANVDARPGGAGGAGGDGAPTEADLVDLGRSLTRAYLTGERRIPIPRERRTGNGETLKLTGARGHNLQTVDFELPLGTFTCVTGVSGSGKSSLINQTLYPALAAHFHRAQTVPLPYTDIEGLGGLDKVIAIDQSPIGRTPRSNPATYTGLFGHIRDVFVRVPEAQIRGYKPGRFSFNVKGGRCETCKGAGLVKLEMNFLPDVYVECETCRGKRYNPETLDIRFKGLNIAEVLEMTVSEALETFANIPRIARKLRTLEAVGLGYIRLGQQATTLSGGEAQRVKLSKELSRPGTGQTLYIFDEPTTGLHFEDIRLLLGVLRALVEKGNTVLVIEHNTDVMKVADRIVDLGPGGGAAGGQILFSGTPEEMAHLPTDHPSATAPFVREELQRHASDERDDEGLLDLDLFASRDDETPDEDDTPDDEPEADESVEANTAA